MTIICATRRERFCRLKINFKFEQRSASFRQNKSGNFLIFTISNFIQKNENENVTSRIKFDSNRIQQFPAVYDFGFLDLKLIQRQNKKDAFKLEGILFVFFKLIKIPV
jgi:hypothetical protein